MKLKSIGLKTMKENKINSKLEYTLNSNSEETSITQWTITLPFNSDDYLYTALNQVPGSPTAFGDLPEPHATFAI